MMGDIVCEDKQTVIPQPSQPDPSDSAALLRAARSGDELAFADLSEPHRNALMTHCYQLLGSLEDAEDMVQETLLRAWSRLDGFDGRSAFRTWLYRIATNLCIDHLRKQQRQGGAALEFDSVDVGSEEEEGAWAARYPSIDPLPDGLLPMVEASPETAYLVRESVNIAFMTLVHRLPPRQRVILLLRDVLNWQTREVAEFLDTTELAVNSALLRARSAVQEGRSGRTPQAGARVLLRRYVDAWETRNIDAFMALLKEDALISMPPLPISFEGISAIREFVTTTVFDPQVRWTFRRAGANGQPAFVPYRREGNGRFEIAGLQLLTLDDDRIVRIDHYVIGRMPGATDAVYPPWLRFFDFPLSLDE